MPKTYRESEIAMEHQSTVEMPKWYAAYTATHHEKTVLDQLTDRQVESYLPLYKTSRRWKKRSAVTLDLPLFPNYVFVRIPPSKRATVLGVTGVYSIVGSTKKAWELPEQEIEILRNGLHDRQVEPHFYLNIGERARIKSGLLSGLEGIVIQQKSNLRFVLSMDQIMQSISIEVDSEELEPLREIATVSGNAPLLIPRWQPAVA